MLNTVEILEQEKHSTLPQTPATRNGANTLPVSVTDYSFEEFMAFSEALQPKYFRITTRKNGINIIFGLTKKIGFFGFGATFQDAFRLLIYDYTEPKI